MERIVRNIPIGMYNYNVGVLEHNPRMMMTTTTNFQQQSSNIIDDNNNNNDDDDNTNNNDTNIVTSFMDISDIGSGDRTS